MQQRKMFNHQLSIINSQYGFSLIELIVVIGMLAILFLALIFTFNPLTQINKAKDSQREHDFAQIKSALDAYYNDHSCYPDQSTFKALIGQQWKDGQTLYMQKIPQDPDCTQDPNKCYVYETDGTNCSQWNVLYAALRGPVANKNACPLQSRDNCLPQGFNGSGYNYCVLSGNVDCSIIASFVINTAGSGGGGGGGGAPTQGPTPTPYIANCGSGATSTYHACTGDNRCNSIYPYDGVCYGHGGTLQCYCTSDCSVNGVKQCAH